MNPGITDELMKQIRSELKCKPKQETVKVAKLDHKSFGEQAESV
jgi:hypothetical protein